MRQTLIVLAVAVASAAAPCLAIDRWEAVTAASPVGDDDSTTINEPRHGSVQVGHDFDSASDQDWMRVVTHARRSYEARAWSGAVPWNSPACPIGACARLDKTDSGGNVQVAGASEGVAAASSVVRWIGTDQTAFLRAVSATGLTNLTYDVAFYDTTYFAPRFNNSGTQATVVIVQNTKPVDVSGQVDFYNAAGTHLHSQLFSLAPSGTLVFITTTVPVLQNVSGSVSIAHTAGYGGLTGKAVAVEPATGFTFDTAFTPLPY